MFCLDNKISLARRKSVLQCDLGPNSDRLYNLHPAWELSVVKIERSAHHPWENKSGKAFSHSTVQPNFYPYLSKANKGVIDLYWLLLEASFCFSYVCGITLSCNAVTQLLSLDCVPFRSFKGFGPTYLSSSHYLAWSVMECKKCLNQTSRVFNTEIKLF